MYWRSVLSTLLLLSGFVFVGGANVIPEGLYSGGGKPYGSITCISTATKIEGNTLVTYMDFIDSMGDKCAFTVPMYLSYHTDGSSSLTMTLGTPSYWSGNTAGSGSCIFTPPKAETIDVTFVVGNGRVDLTEDVNGEQVSSTLFKEDHFTPCIKSGFSDFPDTSSSGNILYYALAGVGAIVVLVGIVHFSTRRKKAAPYNSSDYGSLP
jgi:hypothetical protein